MFHLKKNAVAITTYHLSKSCCVFCNNTCAWRSVCLSTRTTLSVLKLTALNVLLITSLLRFAHMCNCVWSPACVCSVDMECSSWIATGMEYGTHQNIAVYKSVGIECNHSARCYSIKTIRGESTVVIGHSQDVILVLDCDFTAWHFNSLGLLYESVGTAISLFNFCL